jgi:hypothetical protein
MNSAFFIAFGGPLLLGFVALAIAYLIAPRRAVRSAAQDDETLRSTLADAERAARLAADGIARVREQIALSGGRH